MAHSHHHSHGHHSHPHHPDMLDLTHFKTEAEGWDERPDIKETRERIFKVILEKGILHRDARLLDFGCGPGGLTAAMASHVSRATGLDATPEMITVAQKKWSHEHVPNLNFKCLFLEDEAQLPEIGAPFDIIVSTLTFHHLPDVAKTLGILAKGLAPGGQIVIIDLLKTDHSHHFHPEDKLKSVASHGFGPKQMEEEFARAGLHKVVIDTPLSVHKDDGSGHKSEHPIMFARAFKPAA